MITYNMCKRSKSMEMCIHQPLLEDKGKEAQWLVTILFVDFLCGVLHIFWIKYC